MAAKFMDLIPTTARATRSTYDAKDKMGHCFGGDGDPGKSLVTD